MFAESRRKFFVKQWAFFLAFSAYFTLFGNSFNDFINFQDLAKSI